MTRGDLLSELEFLADEVYEKLEEMERLLMDEAPETYERARGYWLAHIDGALFNRRGLLGGSFVALADTLEEIEEGYALCPSCGDEGAKDGLLDTGEDVFNCGCGVRFAYH